MLLTLILIYFYSSYSLAATYSVGNGQYTTLSAVNNPQNGDIIILTSDVNVGGDITWGKNITIKGNGYSIQRSRTGSGSKKDPYICHSISLSNNAQVILENVILDGNGYESSTSFVTVSGSSKLIMDAASKITNVGNYPAVNLTGGSLIGGQITGCENTLDNNGIVSVSNANSLLANCRITENTIRNNSNACAVYLKGKMVNCVVADNERENVGFLEREYNPQAVAAYDGSYVINSTIVNNTNLYGYYRISGTSYLYNSIIWGNSSDASWNTQNYSNCVTTDPKLSSDYSLTANSTNCINLGNNTYFTANSTLSTDIAGNSRFIGTIDVGAYELGANIYYAELTAKYGNTDCTNQMGALTSSPAIPSWTQDANHLYSFAISSGSSSTQDVTVSVENASFTANRTAYVFDHWETSDGTPISGNTLTFKQDKNNANQYVAIYKKPSYFWMNAQTEDGVEIGRSNFSNVPGLVYDGKSIDQYTQSGFEVNRFSTTFTNGEWNDRMPEVVINDVIYEFDHWEKVKGTQERKKNVYTDPSWESTEENNPTLTQNKSDNIWSELNNKNTRTCTYYTAIYKVKGTTYYATLTAKGNDGTPLSSEFTSAEQTLRHASDLYSFTITPKQDNITTKDVSVTPVATKQTITETIDGEQITYTFDHWELNGVKVTGPLTFNVNKTAANYVAIYKSDKCAVIQASKTQDIKWGEKIDLTVNELDEGMGLDLNFQWQSSTNGRTWTNIAGDEAKEEEYSFIAQSGFHLYYRLAVTPRGESSPCYSNAVKLSSAACSEPTLSVTGPGVTVLKEELIYEVNAGSSFTIAVNTVNVPNFSCTLTQTPLQRTGTVILTPTRSDNSGYIYQISNLSDSYTYKLTYKNCNGRDVTKEFNVRVVYKCTSDYSERIWFDDFGRFEVTGTGKDKKVTYYYKKDINDNKEFTVTSVSENCTGYYQVNDNRDPKPVLLTYNKKADDGQYNITNNSYGGMCNSQMGSFTDHTGNTNGIGAMLFANLHEESKGEKIYSRPFYVECEDAYVIFSMYVANANEPVHATWCNCDLSVVNVRLDIYEDGVATPVAHAYSGDLPSREVCSAWHNLSAKFIAKKDIQYTMVLVSNKDGGAGNDALIDDISITVCYPDVALSDDPYVTNENHHMAVCGKDKSDASVYVSCSGEITDYFISPLFLYQFQDAYGNWQNLIEGDNPYSSESGFNVDLKDERLDDNQGFRVIVAKDRIKLDAIMSTYNNTGAFPKVACDNYYGISNENFTIAYYPDLGELGDENHLACPNDEVTLHKDLTGYNYRRWYDKNWNEITSARGQESYTFTMERSTQTYNLVVAAEDGICADTATFKTSVNRRVALTCEDITLQTEENASSCSVQYTLVHPTASSCSSDQFTYYYNTTSKTSPYILFTEGTSLTVEDGDVIYWVVVMDNDVTLTDTCSQSIIVADSTAPVLATISDSLLDFSLNGCVYKIPDLSTVALSAATDNCTAKANLTFVEQSVLAGSEYTQTDAQQTIPVVVKVKDEAGNIGEQTVNVIIPANNFTFECADYAFLSEDGQIEFDCPAVTPAGSVVEWSTNNTALSTTGGKISGTLPFGNTTVTISAKKCDKKVDCSTTITVIKRADACGHDE